MSSTPRYLNHIPRTTLLITKVDGAIADLGVISKYMEAGAYAADDIDMLMTKVEGMSVAVNEMRVGIEISAEARCIGDKEYEDMIDEADPDGD